MPAEVLHLTQSVTSFGPILVRARMYVRKKGVGRRLLDQTSWLDT